MNRRLLKNFLAIIVFGLAVVGMVKSVSALTYQYGIGVSFTFDPTIRITVSSDLRIDNLVPGTASDSNIINVNVVTNTMYGYTLNATVGNNTTAYNTRDLVHSNTSISNVFTSLAYSTNPTVTTNTDFSDDTWGYSYSVDDGTNWSNYNGLPKYDDTTNVATLKTTTGPVESATGDNIKFKIAAKASANQPAGTYNNVINFVAVATPEPTPQPIDCPANTICYAPNALDVTDTMGDQTRNYNDNTNAITSNMSVNLWPSNFKRDGYGFAGWNTELDGSGTMYGPNENITTPSTMGTEGLALYATWVQSAGYMQNWDGCSSMNIGDVTALSDLRDNDTYAVAKLADGKCWMIENLRLDNTATLTTANTNNPLNNGTDVTLKNTDGTTTNHLSASTNPTTTAWCVNYNSACYDQSMLFTGNTTNSVTNMTTPTNMSQFTGQNIYSYGNYYNWYSATAGRGTYSKSSGNTEGDICPAGWHLPTGNTGGEFYAISTQANSGSTSSSAGLMAYPNNFVYSGDVGGPNVYGRGIGGYYWSSTANNSIFAYSLYFGSSYVYPGTSGYNIKFSGFMARCVLGS